MRRAHRPATAAAGTLTIAVLSAGCVLAPASFHDEEARHYAAAPQFAVHAAERPTPELPAAPDWRDVLHYAFLSNGDLEDAYFAWRAALAQVRVAGTYPDTNLALNFNFLFSPRNMTAWDRTTLTAGPDPMENLSLPDKVMASAAVALAEARAAAASFAQRKFRLQEEVLSAYFDYALVAERLRLRHADVDLLALEAATARQQLLAGAAQQDYVNADRDRDLGVNTVANLEADTAAARAKLNALIGRAPEAALPLPESLPAARELALSDPAVIALVAEANPEVGELAARVEASQHALELARLQYIPNINPFITITGGIERAAGAMFSMAALPKIRAMVDAARASRRAAEAAHAQRRYDVTGETVAALTMLRNDERQLTVFRDRILPAARLIATNRRDAFRAGAGPIGEVIAAERNVLDVRLIIAELQVAREKDLLMIERLAAMDLERTTIRAATGAEEEAL